MKKGNKWCNIPKISLLTVSAENGCGEQISTDADDGHLVTAVEFHGLGLEVEWIGHTECDAVDFVSGYLISRAVCHVYLCLLALHVQTDSAQQGGECKYLSHLIWLFDCCINPKVRSSPSSP